MEGFPGLNIRSKVGERFGVIAFYPYSDLQDTIFKKIRRGVILRICAKSRYEGSFIFGKLKKWAMQLSASFSNDRKVRLRVEPKRGCNPCY